MKLLPSLVAALFAFPALAQNIPPDFDIRQHCRRIAPDSYSLQETCIDLEARDRRAIQQMVTSGTPSVVWRHCIRIASDSYSLLRTCLDMESHPRDALKA
jgi:hypothetical protein